MTDMPERLYAWKNSRGRISAETERRSDGQSEYLRAYLVAAKDAEIARLRGLLKRRQDAPHTHNCGGHWQGLDWTCDCGHSEAAAYFKEIGG